MTSTIDTLGKAARHGMIVRVACGCGNVRDYLATEMLARFGAGRDPRRLPFRCSRCRPPVTITLLERPKAVKTLGEAIDANESYRLCCHDYRCRTMHEIDLVALAGKLGRDHGAMHDDLMPILWCKRCRDEGRPGRDISLNVTPDYDGIMRQKAKT
jgi:hypothetical protein